MPAGALAILPLAPPPRGPRRETWSLRARFLETPHSRNLRGCFGLTDPGVPRAPAGLRSPKGQSRSPRLRPPAPSGPRPTSLLKSPRGDLTLPGVEVNFPRPGDEERELVEQPRQPLDHPHGSTRGIPTGEANSSRPPPRRLPSAPLPLLPLACRSPRRPPRRLSSLRSSSLGPGPARRATLPVFAP